MFNLFRSRTKAVKYLLGALMMLVALSMVTYLIPGYGSSGDSSRDQILAEIGKEDLSLQEAEQGVRRALQNRPLPPELVALYVPQIVDQMITERALAYEADRLGYEVTSSELAAAIRSSIPQLFPNGQFAGKEAYDAFLRQQNTSIPEFEANMRKQMMLTRLRNLVLEGVVVTPAEIEKEYRRKNYKVKLEFVSVSPEKFKSIATVSPEQIKQWYDKAPGLYRTQEKRSLDVLVIDPAKLAESLTIPDAELLRTYNTNIERYRVPERVKVRHILLKTQDKPPAEIPKIQARAEDLLKQLKGSADFATLAKKNSEDSGSADKGGDLGWVTRGQTVKAFEDTAFSLKPNETSGVIKTEYGFHILHLEEKETAHVKPFSEVKNELAEERKKQLVYDRVQGLADQARAELSREPLQGEAIAKRLGVEFVRVDKVGPGDPIPQVGVAKEFTDAISPLKKGEVSPVTGIPGNKLVVVAMRDVFPAGQAALAEVEAQIRTTLLAGEAERLQKAKADEVFYKTKAANNDLAKVAKSLGLEVKTTQEFGPDGAADGIGSATNLRVAFTLDQGQIFGPMRIGDPYFICKIAGKAAPDMSQLAKQRDDLLTAIKRKKAQEREELFEDGVLMRLTKEGKVKIHEDVKKRLVANYRG